MPEPPVTVASVVRRRRVSAVWLIPLVTIAVAGWLAWDTLSKRGPLITITFEAGEGLQAGQSSIKHKDVTMGQVQSIELSPDLTHVVVTARMNRESERLLTDNARFWVVKPRLFAGSISGLGTLLSGSYIQLLPSAEGGQRRLHFTGLETPPVLQQTTPGTTYLLKARRLGSVSLGSPIFYRDLTVGEVLGWDIGDMADSVSIHAFVHAPFDHYVREDTRFWNASGVSLKLGADGLQVQVESLLAILLGGIAFDAPVGADGPALKAGEISFPLYDDEAAANAAGFRRRLQLLAYFPGTVDGLAPGAPVKLFGISIGQVTGVGLEYDPKSDAIRVPVHFEVQPERIADVKLAEGRGPLANVRILVQRGMRAQLQSANLLTGQKEVSLTIVQNAPPADVSTEGDVIVVPTSSGGFSELSQSVNDLLARLNKMPFDQIGENLNATLEGLNGIANGPALQKSLASLQSTMKAAQDVLTRLDAGAAPALRRLPGIANDMQAVLARTNALLASAQSGYGDNSRIYRNLDRVLVQLNEMVQSVRVLADLLNRHPEALVRGRTDGGGSP